MERFNVGDIVKLREDSRYASQSDGKNGIINEIQDHEYCYQITWDNGHSNRYRAIDVELVTSFTSLVDKYIVVYDDDDGEAYFQVVEDNCCFDDYGSRYVKVIGVNFDRVVANRPVNVMICNGNKRSFTLMTSFEKIVWLNKILQKCAYVKYCDWISKISKEDKLKVECLVRYPNLEVGEKFEINSSTSDKVVREIHPRNWTIGVTSSCDYTLYLAKDGEGGAKVYSNGKWAKRLTYRAGADPYIEEDDDDSKFSSSSWCVACTINGEGQDELREWKGGSKWNHPGYIDNRGWWTQYKPENKHLISYQTFLDKVYYPFKGIKPPPVVIKESAVVTSSTTHLPYLNISTKEKRTLFIEDVQPIKIKTSKRVPNKLKIN
jgi:hypothetical protein